MTDDSVLPGRVAAATDAGLTVCAVLLRVYPGRERHPEERPAASAPRAQLYRGAVALGDRLHDREPQPAAGDARAEDPVEAIEDEGSLRFGDAGAGILDL